MKAENELVKLYEESLKEIHEGQILTGKVVKIDPSEVMVDIGYKSEAMISAGEFDNLDTLKEGDEIDVFIENCEDEKGKLILSHYKAKKLKGWQKLIENHKEGDIVEGIVRKRVKGGFQVSVFDVDSFLPGSLSMFKGMAEQEIKGKVYRFMILKLYRSRRNVIVSRKDAMIREREEQKKKLWEDLEAGKVIKGRVKSFTDFGAFIDLGGVDGLLHIVDMSWTKVNHPSEILRIGEEISIMVLSFDKNTGKISLGLKQLLPDPWENIEEKYPANSVVKGRITNILPYGLFVEIEKGIEGLVHITEVRWSRKSCNLQEMYSLQDVVEARVLNIDKNSRRIALSIKSLLPDPWENVEKKYAPGTMIKGKVVGFIDSGAFIEFEPGIEGFVHIKDMSWTRKINHPQEFLHRSQEVETFVLNLDKEGRRLSLGIKQLKPNPWPEIIEKYPKGKIVDTEVVKITSFGVFAKIEEDLEGLVFADEIDKTSMESLKIGDQIRARIIKVDAENAKIGLSAKLEEEPADTEQAAPQEQGEEQEDSIPGEIPDDSPESAEEIPESGDSSDETSS